MLFLRTNQSERFLGFFGMGWGLLGFWFCFGFFCARISLKYSGTDREAKTHYLAGRNAKTKHSA